MSRQTPNERDRTIGRELALRRRAANKTQQHVGDHIGVTWQQISKYERGEDCISASRRDQIIEYLEPVPLTGFSEAQAPYLSPRSETYLRTELENVVRDLNSILDRL
ncbi:MULTISPECIES: helix-turn-helix domain-containing protein [unclassified Mesorhizobium]|uniref:helix-turn-helix domain-containing protein n=1 Tax=Mesorhizobium sp. Root1471 TaxID=1736469 RepID=UPI0006F47D67